jgi:protein-tyrosine-phosphatase
MNKHKELIKIYFGLSKINFMDEILDELGISEDMRIPKPGKIVDYDERDIVVAKALKVVKERKKEEVAAFRKMAQEMREQKKIDDPKKES